MRGGIILFRGSGQAARHYLESDHSLADDYFLEGGNAVAHRRISQGSTNRFDVLESGDYGKWVDWIDPVTGEIRGKPRKRAIVRDEQDHLKVRLASPMFAEISVNVPKSLSLAAELNVDVSTALDAAEQKAADALHDYILTHCGTRIGERGNQRAVLAERLESVTIKHRTSRAGDPHRHLHFQVSTRIFAEGKWRALDTDVLFRQQALLRSLGEAVINTDTALQEALQRAGFTFDSTRGEVRELEEFVPAMSKRAAQIEAVRERLVNEWKEEHNGREPNRLEMQGIDKQAWALGRPEKRPNNVPTREMWLKELRDLGYVAPQPPDEMIREQDVHHLSEEEELSLVDDILVHLGSQRSTWAIADLEGVVYHHLIAGKLAAHYRLVNESTLRATAADLTERVLSQCVFLSTDYWRHTARATAARMWTSPHVLQADTDMRQALIKLADIQGEYTAEIKCKKAEKKMKTSLDLGQRQAACALAGTHQLVVIEGAAGAGKTTMLKVARHLMDRQKRPMRVVTPTLKAAQAANREAGVDGNSLAKLLHANGYRWDEFGRWCRIDQVDTRFLLTPGETIIIDEAGMVDVDTMNCLLELASESQARIVMIGDRAQMPAVGRGGVLDAAYDFASARVQLDKVHRFRDPHYAQTSLALRERQPEAISALMQDGHVSIASTFDHIITDVSRSIASDLSQGIHSVAVVASNDTAARVSCSIRRAMIDCKAVEETPVVTFKRDDNQASIGDLIQIRQNNASLGVANRDMFVIADSDKETIILEKPGRDNLRRVVPRAWLIENATLGYALTAHGVQGETVENSHVLINEDEMNGSALYVGLTRGRAHNQVHIVSSSPEEAVIMLTDIMHKDGADKGVDKASKDALNRLETYNTNGPALITRNQLRDLTLKRNRLADALLARAATMSAEKIQADLKLLTALDEHIQDEWAARGRQEPSRHDVDEKLRLVQRRVRIQLARTGHMAAPAHGGHTIDAGPQL